MMNARPSRDGHLELPDGRRMAFAEFGDVDGVTLVLLHGNPGSRLACPDLPTTRELGIRLVTFDRPGFGGSDPAPLHRLPDVAADLVHLLDHLGLDRVAVLGWSGGGPYALAFAALHPTRVIRAVSLSGSELADDPELLATRTPRAARLIERLRNGDLEALSEVESGFGFYAQDPRAIIGLTLANESDPDRRLMSRPEVAEPLAIMWEEGARQGAIGVAAGWAALWALDRGFDPGELEAPVTVWHGAADVVVPVGAARRLADAIPQASLRIIPGEGHLIALEHWRGILEDARSPA